MNIEGESERDILKVCVLIPGTLYGYYYYYLEKVRGKRGKKS